MFSGKNGATLLTIHGETGGDRFGSSVARLGDLNGDGYPEYAAGGPQPNLIGLPGYVKVVSGKDGKLLRRLASTVLGDRFGSSVCAAGDVNGDGVPDLWVGADQTGNGGAGYARLYSGKDWSVLRTLSGRKAGDEFGAALDGGSDLDRDGRPDLLVGAPGADINAGASGTAFAFSGKTGAVLFTVDGDSFNDRLGTTVAGVGDLDGDGHPDFAAGAPFDNGGGSVHVFSGKDKRRLFRFDGDSAGDEFGFAVAGVGDLNDDGRPDLLVGAPGDDNVAQSAGAARLLSGQALTLWTDVHRLSLKQAGTQRLSLAAGAANANRFYQVFGSLSGTRPGLQLGGVLVPLNVDPYTSLAMQLVNSPVLQAFRGQLDGAGQASAAFQVPASLPAVVDVTLFHAYLVYDASGIYMASNAATLRLEN